MRSSPVTIYSIGICLSSTTTIDIVTVSGPVVKYCVENFILSDGFLLSPSPYPSTPAASCCLRTTYPHFLHRRLFAVFELPSLTLITWRLLAVSEVKH